ncbi:fibulin-1-like isoform X4, partial [Leptotrombidium deliense]
YISIKIVVETSTAAINLTLSVNENTSSADTYANGLKRNTKCDEGFTFNFETGLCIDIRCDDGFQYYNETKICEDIDECKLPEKVCSSWQQCLNTNGSFLCENIQCEPGFEANDNGECKEIKCSKGRIVDKKTNNCVNFNVCESNPCEVGKECVNTIGSYECRELKKCEPGLEKLMGQCVDIDECKRFQHNCSADRRTCEDVDECVGIISCMLPKSHCKNTIGGHECVCPPGYKETIDDCIATDL